MATLLFENFGGMIPRTSPRLLPQGFAQEASNVKLLSGELRGWRQPKVEYTFTTGGNVQAFRIPASETGSDDLWLGFAELRDVARGPLVNDTYKRYYWTGESKPMYNTVARLVSEDDAYILGVPQPTTGVSVGVTGGSAPTETRSYVYTFVSTYGEEGPPSNPTLHENGNIDGTWNLTGIETTVPDSSERTIAYVNIYRTVTGDSSSAFYYVDQIAFGTSTYDDTESSVDVASNNLLESTSWFPPPTTLLGLKVASNGMMVGFSGREVYLSEPYRPHAWPPEYALSVEHDIVEVMPFLGGIAVLTEANPYVMYGSKPASMGIDKFPMVEPCLSKRGVVGTDLGVFYPSQNGLVLMNLNGVGVASRSVITKDTWENRYMPANLVGVRYGTRYMAVYDSNIGLLFDPSEPQAALSEFSLRTPPDDLFIDRFSGDIFLLVDDVVYQWDPSDTEPTGYVWKSKLVHLPKPVNFAAMRVRFNTNEFEIDSDYVAGFIAANELLLNDPLNPINQYEINGSYDDLTNDIPPRGPIGGSGITPLSSLDGAPYIQIDVYADKEFITTISVTDEKAIRMPSGYKADFWELRVRANADIYSIKLATHAGELERV